MPSRNVTKIDVHESYYHVYARGNNRQTIFCDEADYSYFAGLLKRYLSNEQVLDKNGVPYPNYCNKVELLAYCIMPNHFHFLLWQQEQGDMSGLMRSLMTAYSRYFNLKYKRTGGVFEGRYRASRVDQESYLMHISRYIHLNPRYWQRYPYSSLKYYFAESAPAWFHPLKISDMFDGRVDYINFLKDYEQHKEMLEEIKYDLADR